MSSFAHLIGSLTPDIYESLKQAVETGKWADGSSLTQEQKELSLQAMIAYEVRHLPEDQRTGYMGDQHCASKAQPVPNILLKSDAIH